MMCVLSVCERMFQTCTVRILRLAVTHMPQTLTKNDLKCVSDQGCNSGVDCSCHKLNVLGFVPSNEKDKDGKQT